ncbi:MAG TPA: Fe2+-dependent dioxygenase [Xanthomonadales bacterium]|nr:Fe2+-dependent dioxygenase [Xanthomonadales bacterium]
MLITIDDVLDPASVRRLRELLDAADWIDGRITAGSLATTVKRNQQLDVESDLAVSLGNQLLRVLGNHPLFLSAALPEKIVPPRFNRYADGGSFGTHVDSAIMRVERANLTLRSDLSATLFLCDPDEYDGGELLIETPFGAQSVKLPAGALVLYPSSSLHQVTAVTRGARTCAFFWIQSLVRDEGERTLLFDLDQNLQQLRAQLPAEDQRLLALHGVYHNLLRRWASP